MNQQAAPAPAPSPSQLSPTTTTEKQERQEKGRKEGVGNNINNIINFSFSPTNSLLNWNDVFLKWVLLTSRVFEAEELDYISKILPDHSPPPTTTPTTIKAAPGTLPVVVGDNNGVVRTATKSFVATAFGLGPTQKSLDHVDDGTPGDFFFAKGFACVELRFYDFYVFSDNANAAADTLLAIVIQLVKMI